MAAERLPSHDAFGRFYAAFEPVAFSPASAALLLEDDWSPQSLAAALRTLICLRVREALIARGYERVQSCIWANTAKQTLVVYQRVACQPSVESLTAHEALRGLWG